LQRLGVEVRLDTLVTDCDQQGVTFGDTAIPTANIIWAAGVQASPAGQWLNVDTDRAGRIPVNQNLSISDFPDIYVIGDTAAVTDRNGRPVPAVAPAAK